MMDFLLIVDLIFYYNYETTKTPLKLLLPILLHRNLLVRADHHRHHFPENHSPSSPAKAANLINQRTTKVRTYCSVAAADWLSDVLRRRITHKGQHVVVGVVVASLPLANNAPSLPSVSVGTARQGSHCLWNYLLLLLYLMGPGRTPAVKQEDHSFLPKGGTICAVW